MTEPAQPEVLTPIKPKHPGGRPLLWDDPQELSDLIDQYFAKCDKGREITEPNKRGEIVTYRQPIPYTYEGLAHFLDVETKTIWNYAKRDKFLRTLSRARQKIQASWLEHGLTGRFNAKIANLCLAATNNDYRINQQHDLTIESMEDKLRRIQQQRLEHKPKPALPGPDNG